VGALGRSIEVAFRYVLIIANLCVPIWLRDGHCSVNIAAEQWPRAMDRWIFNGA
jgi:hypothetical protein